MIRITDTVRYLVERCIIDSVSSSVDVIINKVVVPDVCDVVWHPELSQHHGMLNTPTFNFMLDYDTNF